MDNRKVSFKNFWPEGYVGHTTPDGKDVGKEFLMDLFSGLEVNELKETVVHSHFIKKSKISRILELIRKIQFYINPKSIESQKKLHGHQTDSYEIPINSFNVWYTSENLRPPLNESFDFFLSHDLDRYDGRNHYLPIWATRLGSNLDEANRIQEAMSRVREVDISGRSGVCAVISNPEPIRMAFIKELQKHVDIDIYGAFGIPAPDKDSILRQYKINICFENDEFPGYVTEKPFEAWSMGCVPVWRGLDSGGYLNKQALIDVSRLGFEKSLTRILKILKDESEYLNMASQPILVKQYDYNELRKRIVLNYNK